MNKNELGSVIITGASRGIGAATAQRLAREGYSVCVNYLKNHGAADQVVKAIRAAGGRAISVQGDVAKEADVEHLFVETEKALGPLHGLVNNAAILETQMRLVDMSPERIDRIFATNVRGTFLCARAAIKRLSADHGGNGGQGGVIVNVSSAAARLGSPGEYIDYAASKGAIDTLTLGLATEVADQGIRVNAVRPGVIDTEMHASGGEPNRPERVRGNVPLKRPGQAIEVANAICWLVSDESSYCTGSIIDVAGGR